MSLIEFSKAILPLVLLLIPLVGVLAWIIWHEEI